MSAVATSRPSTWEIAAARFDAIAFALVAIVPLAMALINRSAQPLLVASAVCALAARASAGEIGLVRDRLATLLQRPVARLCLAFLLFAAVSIAWGHHAKVSISAYGELLLSAGAALVLHAALPRAMPAWVPKVATIAAAIGCLTMIAELSNGMSFRAELGIRNYTFIFKRSVTAIMILAWPVGAALWLAGKRSVAVAAGFLFGLAVYASHSSATALGIAVGLGFAALAIASRRAASFVLAGALGTALLVAPVLGDLAARLLPAGTVAELQFAHAEDRISIWQSFGEVVRRRPILGVGFGTSSAMAQEPVAEEVPENRRVLLGAWHPHNGFLQLWAETGLVGVLLGGAALVLTALGIARLGPYGAPAAAALVGSAGAVMLVGHGLWQGWWCAILGIGAVWIARLPDPRRYGERSIPPRKPVAST